MSGLSQIFGAGVRARNEFYDRGWLVQKRLSWPVISVGNLSTGGSGKTPFTIALGVLLQERGVAFDVLSRGYRRKTTGVRLADVNDTAADSGDEPLLIARTLQVPVIVGASRYAAGRYAEKSFAQVRPAHGKSFIHLLDDGFQHRALVRDVDIVLVSSADAVDRLLPAGRLREPLESLRRADVVVMEENDEDSLVRPFAKEILRTRRALTIVSASGSEAELVSPVVFCGVAKPERFESDLRRMNIVPQKFITFRDHHAYSEADVAELLRSGIGPFLTTEKDLMNLGPLAEKLPGLHIAKLRTELIDAGAAVDSLLAKIGF